MTKLKHFPPFFCLTAVLFFFALFEAQAQRTKVSLNDAWYFEKGSNSRAFEETYDHSAWLPIQIPHTWNDKDVLADGQRGYFRGEGWYRRDIHIPEDGKRRYLHFEGANQVTVLYVNGLEVGSHTGGYTAFTFDITPYLKSGANVLAVKVDNSHDASIPPLSADFTFFGGIYRNLWLVTTEQIHVDMLDHGSNGVFIDCTKLDKNRADLRVRGRIVNHFTEDTQLKIVSTVYDQNYTSVYEMTDSVTVNGQGSTDFKQVKKELKGFKLWKPERPTVYTIRTAVYANSQLLDEVYNPFGFRWFEFDPSDGFLLNGSPLKLMGANRHQDRMGLGNALSDDLHRKDIDLLKEMGANFLRTAHYPQSRAVLEATDRSGILVWEEIPLVNEITISEAFTENSKTMLKEMIRQHYNHPSVVIWGYMNEIYWKHRFLPEEELPDRNDYTLFLAKELESIARSEDSTRYTAMAVHNYPLYEESGILDVPMIIGWNLYHGWYYDTYEDFGKFMDAQHENHPERILMVSEFGAGSDLRLSSSTPERYDFSTEGQLNFMSAFLSQIDERPFIAGAAVWNLIDFSSERRVDPISHLNSKGLLTADRQPKDAYYLTQCFMSKDPRLRIGHTWQDRLTYRSVAVNDSIWKGEIRAFSNSKICSLYVDGHYVGTAVPEGCIARWNLSHPAGTYKVCVEADGKSHCSDKLLEVLPFELSSDIDVALNFGTDQYFFDPLSGINWVAAPIYESGSYGYVGGERVYVGGKPGTKEDILTTESLDPLYQTMLEDIETLRFDVPDGRYEVELLMVDYLSKSRRFADLDEKVQKESGKRIVHLHANGEPTILNLDLGGEYGKNMPARIIFAVEAENGEGVSVDFIPVKGKALLSAARLRRL